MTVVVSAVNDSSNTTRPIQSLAPRVSRAQAIEEFRRGWWRALAGRRLRSVAAVHVPFRLYEVDVTNGGRQTRSIFAADAVTGTLDLYEFESVPTAAELVRLETANLPLPRLTEERSLELIESRVQRAVFQAGFFRVRGLEIRARRLPTDIHIPYWLGFVGNEDRAQLRVMDAVRRRMEGAKARALFEDWLMAG